MCFPKFSHFLPENGDWFPWIPYCMICFILPWTIIWFHVSEYINLLYCSVTCFSIFSLLFVRCIYVSKYSLQGIWLFFPPCIYLVQDLTIQIRLMVILHFWASPVLGLKDMCHHTQTLSLAQRAIRVGLMHHVELGIKPWSLQLPKQVLSSLSYLTSPNMGLFPKETICQIINYA